MKKILALILSLVLCLGTVSFGAVVSAEGETNLLLGTDYVYSGNDAFFKDFMGNDNNDNSGVLLTDGITRDNGSSFNDIYGVPGTTVEIEHGEDTIVTFTLANPSVINYAVLGCVRRSGNRYINIVSIQTSANGVDYNTVSFTETAYAISGAPLYDGDDQYFDVKATFTKPAEGVKYLRFAFNTYDKTGTQQAILNIDEIEAYGYANSPYSLGANVELSSTADTVRTGDLIAVDVSIKDISTPFGIVSCDLPLTYDTEKLELVSVTPKYPTAWGNKGILVGEGALTASPCWLRMVCDASDLLTNSAYYVKEDGVMGFTLLFKGKAEGSALIAVDNDMTESRFLMIVDGGELANYGAEGDSLTLTVSNSAQSAVSYTVSYDANGGVNAPAAQTKLQGAPLALSNSIPVRDGYTFLGWASSKDSAKSEYSAGAIYSADADITLYAVWAEGSSIVFGDVNSDGKVNSLDAAMILRYDAALADFTDKQIVCGDVSGDGRTNSLDAAFVLRYDADLIGGFPVSK